MPFLSQTPGGKGIWHDYQFIVNDPTCKQCDYWFVAAELWDKLNDDNIAICPKENVYLMMGEVLSDIRPYSKSFVKQFYNLIGLQNDKYQANIKYDAVLPYWFVGLTMENNNMSKVNMKHNKSFDELLSIKECKKTKLISVVSSNKVFTEGHMARFEFCRKLKEYFGDEIDFFGRGHNDFEDKWDVVAPYKYHVAIENAIIKNYFTEKLLDPFLAYCLPIYCGAPNIQQYFDPRSMLKIDIYRPEESIKLIEKAIRENEYEKRREYIYQMRKDVLYKYNMFERIRTIVEQNKSSGSCVCNVITPESAICYQIENLPYKIENRIRGGWNKLKYKFCK